MQIPKTIQVFGKEVTVVQTDKKLNGFDPDENWGWFDRETSQIYLTTKRVDNQLAATIMHEIIHSVCDRVGIHQAVSTELEEVISESISVAFSELFVIKFR